MDGKPDGKSYRATRTLKDHFWETVARNVIHFCSLLLEKVRSTYHNALLTHAAIFTVQIGHF